MAITSNPVTISVGGCNCPPNEICANSDGTCPAGSFPDSSNPGCCVLCSQLQPYAFTNLETKPQQFYYYTNVYDFSTHPSCSYCINNCKTSKVSYYIPITGKLVDSEGHGICKQIVHAYPNQNGQYEFTVNYSFPFLMTKGTATVTWQLALYPSNDPSTFAITDIDGNFTISYLVYGVYNVDEDVPAAMPYGCYLNDSPSVIPMLFYIELFGTTITNEVNAEVVFNSAISKPV